MALCLSTGDTETTAMELRQLVDHMTRNSQRLLGAMVLDRWDSQEWVLLRNCEPLDGKLLQNIEIGLQKGESRNPVSD